MSSAFFLTLYAVAIVAAVIVGRRMARATLPARELPKIPTKPDAYALAWLAEGDAGVVRLATFDLLRHRLIEINADGMVRPLAPPVDALQAVGPVASRLFASLRRPLKADSDYFVRMNAFPEFTELVTGYRALWVDQGLATTAEQVSRAWKITLFCLAGVVLLGGGRVGDALLAGRHNVGFSVGLGIAGLIAIQFLVPLGRVTALGKRYLRDVRRVRDLDHAHVQTWAATEQRGYAGDSLLLGVALLGTGVLGGTAYESMKKNFPARGDGSSCSSGSSCGTSSSDSSGSSDSGGSGCGGGGCGGGGGD